MELQKAIENSEFWLDMWEEEFVDERDTDTDADRDAEREMIRAFRAVVAAAKTTIADPPEDCPHADPYRYCNGCKVNPCPIGLG